MEVKNRLELNEECVKNIYNFYNFHLPWRNKNDYEQIPGTYYISNVLVDIIIPRYVTQEFKNMIKDRQNILILNMYDCWFNISNKHLFYLNVDPLVNSNYDRGVYLHLVQYFKKYFANSYKNHSFDKYKRELAIEFNFGLC